MTRKELNARARTLGIDPDAYNRKEDLAKAIAEVEATLAGPDPVDHPDQDTDQVMVSDPVAVRRVHDWISADHTGKVHS